MDVAATIIAIVPRDIVRIVAIIVVKIELK